MISIDDLFDTKLKHGGLSVADRIDASGDCWEWTGSVSSGGYGQVWGGERMYRIHRFVWEALVGQIGDGLEIDHLCRNVICCNPDHLEPVTRAENLKRGWVSQRNKKSHCVNGHLLSGSNLYIHEPSGLRACKLCQRRRHREWRQRKKN